MNREVELYIQTAKGHRDENEVYEIIKRIIDEREDLREADIKCNIVIEAVINRKYTYITPPLYISKRKGDRNKEAERPFVIELRDKIRRELDVNQIKIEVKEIVKEDVFN